MLLALVTLVAAVTAGIAISTTPVSAHQDSETDLGTTADDDFRNETILSGLNQPTSIEFLPDGRMVALQKGGEIRIADPQTGESSTYMELQNVDTYGERGLLGIALDPNFEENGYFYLYYIPGDTSKSRISRFTHQEREGGLDSRGDRSSEMVVWTDTDDADEASAERPNPDNPCCHYGGGLDVGPDGRLYLTTGEEFAAEQAQNLSEADGKILRVNRNGTIPDDNPWADDGNESTLGEIWAYGLRNPFTATWDHESERFYVGEVGSNTNTDELKETTSWEDIHAGREGANYGWPDCEGECSNDAYDDPVYSYPHTNETGASVTVGTVYHSEQYPSGFDGALFYGDYVRGWIKYLTFDSSGEVTGSHEFHTDAGAVVSIAEGPDGSLYYARIGKGSVERISYRNQDAGGNSASTIESASASPTSGASPLDVEFTGDATDPDGDALTYTWEFGDGATATGQSVTHTYENDGSYAARLKVSDGNETVRSDPIEISVGDAPTATIDAPEDGATFRAGENVTYSGSATDPDDGELSGDSLTWTVQFVHNEHTHPVLSDETGSGGEFHVGTSGHDYKGDTGYKITLTATDSDGLTDTETVSVRPRKVNVTFDSEPSGLGVTVDGIPRTAPYTADTLVGFEHRVNARATQCVDGTRYEFVGWSDGGDRSHYYAVPDSDVTLTAEYEANGTCNAESGLPQDGLALQLEADRGVSTSNGTVTGWADQSSNGNDLSATGDPSLTTSPGGQPAISFDGEEDMLRRDGVNGLPTGSSDRTMFVVAKYDGHGAGDLGGVAYGTPDSNETFGLVVDEQGNLTLQGWSSRNDYHSTTAGVGAGWLTQSAVLNDDSFVHYRNGTEIDSDTHVFDTGDDRITVGGEMTPPPYTDMEVSAVIVYNRSLSGTEYQQVNSHLEEKYLRGSDDGDGTTNEAPAADDDSPSVSAGGSTTVDVLANDSDFDGSLDPSTVTVTSGPSNGSVSVDSSTGEITYTHDGSSSTSDSFTYTVDDDDGATSNEATVSVEVIESARTPTIQVTNPDDGATVADESVTVEWTTTNTSDDDHVHLTLDGDSQGRSDNLDGSQTFTNLSAGDHEVTLELAGADHAAYENPEASAAVSFTVEAGETNPGGGSDDGWNGDETTNEAPTADAGGNRTVEAGETVTLDGSGSTDADGDALTYEWNQTAGSELTLSSDGANDTVTFTAPNVENTMTLTFGLNVTDGGASDTDTVSVTVEPTESAPTDGGDGEGDDTNSTDSTDDNTSDDTDNTDSTSNDTDNADSTSNDTDNADSTSDDTDSTDDDTDTTDSDGDDGTSAGSDENAGSETGDDGNATDGAPNESAAGSAAFDVTVDGPGTATLSVGDQVTVTAHVENVGDARGARTVTFGVDGRTVATHEMHIPAGATRTVQFNQTFDSTGTYEVNVDGTTIATVEVVDEGAQSNNTDTVTGSATPDDGQMGVSTPGFGFGVAFAALLALALTLGAAARRR